MKRALFAVVVLFATIPTVGCGTLVNQSPAGTYFNAKGQTRPNRLYGGVRVDCEMVADTAARGARGESVLSSSSTSEHDPVTGEWVTRDTTPTSTKMRNAVTMTLFLAADFPLSFVADTVLLPSDILAQVKRLTSPKPSEAVTKPIELPPIEEKTKPPAGGLEQLKDNKFNSWQMTRSHEVPLPAR